MKYIKSFEKIGVDKLVYDIYKKATEEFLKNYDEDKVFTNNESDIFYVDISDIVDKKTQFSKIGFVIKYNQAYGKNGFPIEIGAISKKDITKKATLDDMKNDIIHEIQHMIRSYRKRNIIKGYDNFKDSKKLFDFNYHNLINVIVRTCNEDGVKISGGNFLKSNLHSDNFKKLIFFVYLSDNDELASKYHEFITMIHNKNNFNSVYNDSKQNGILKLFFEMKDFKINKDEFSKDEYVDINWIFNIRKGDNYDKVFKNVQMYLNTTADKFIKKIQKASYFSDKDVEI